MFPPPHPQDPAPPTILTTMVRVVDDRLATLARRPRNPEALHDARVAVRRLRSWVRALIPAEGRRARRAQRRLARITDATNPGRDLEILVEWLRDTAGALPRGQVQRARRLAAAVARDRDAARAAAREALEREWPKARARVSQLPAHDPDPAPLVAMLERVVEDFRDCAEQASASDPASDTARLHALRIAGKRVRYLVEPLGERLPALAALRPSLVALQDDLGHWHDLERVEQMLRERAAEAAWSEVGLLAALGTRLSAGRLVTHEALRERWLGIPLAALGRRLAEGVAAFAAATRIPPDQQSVDDALHATDTPDEDDDA